MFFLRTSFNFLYIPSLRLCFYENYLAKSSDSSPSNTTILSVKPSPRLTSTNNKGILSLSLSFRLTFSTDFYLLDLFDDS